MQPHGAEPLLVVSRVIDASVLPPLAVTAAFLPQRSGFLEPTDNGVPRFSTAGLYFSADGGGTSVGSWSRAMVVSSACYLVCSGMISPV